MLSVLFRVLVAATTLFALLCAGAVAAPPERADVVIRFVHAPTTQDIAGLERAGARIAHRYGIVPAVAASVPEAALPGLRDNRRIAAVEADQVVRAFDYRSSHDWGIERVRAGLVHAETSSVFDGIGSGARIAVLDSGIDCEHVELTGARCVHGVNYITEGAAPDDDWGHGTHVAGSAVARRDVGVLEGVVGVAPGATAIAYKVLDDQGYGTTSDVIAAVDSVWNGGAPTADVINMSLGWGSGSTTFQHTMDRAYASGLLLVAAAGNGGSCSGKGSSVSYPAKYSSVIAVAATDSSDKRPCWSSTGEEVELSAPGVSVFSTWPADLRTSYRDPQPVCEASVCHYKYGSGTSMSVPHVTGAAALVIGSGTVTDTSGAKGIADEVRQRLADTAVPLGPATQYGHGLVDAYSATRAPTTTEPQPTEPAETITLSVSGYKHRGSKHVDLMWTPVTSATVDVFRDGTRIDTVANQGSYHDHPPKGASAHTYKVCEADTQTCSNEAGIAF